MKLRTLPQSVDEMIRKIFKHQIYRHFQTLPAAALQMASSFPLHLFI
jgi:hypothetical protein